MPDKFEEALAAFGAAQNLPTQSVGTLSVVRAYDFMNNDCTMDIKCSKCGHVEVDKYAYNDHYYRHTVVPGRKCKNCESGPKPTPSVSLLQEGATPAPLADAELAELKPKHLKRALAFIRRTGPEKHERLNGVAIDFYISLDEVDKYAAALPGLLARLAAAEATAQLHAGCELDRLAALSQYQQERGGLAEIADELEAGLDDGERYEKKKEGYPHLAEAIERAVRRLRATPTPVAIEEGGGAWISVQERLPEEGKKVWVAVKKRHHHRFGGAVVLRAYTPGKPGWQAPSFADGEAENIAIDSASHWQYCKVPTAPAKKEAPNG